MGAKNTPITQGPTSNSQKTTTAFYQCNENKNISATFYKGDTKPAIPGEPPIPGGKVIIFLSDGRTLYLTQTISADGIRYSDGNPMIKNGESIVFWSKGNGAMILEHNEEQTYIGCIQTAPNPGGLPEIYENGAEGFSLRYPTGYSIDPAYRYAGFGPDKEIRGVKFMIPPSMASGTNLGQDTYLSVEEIPQTSSCTARRFLPDTILVSTVTETGTEYSVAFSTGAAAGNRYEETAYALPGTNPCIGIRYFIHYGVLENYPPGMVQAFDRNKLLQQFDIMRRTLVVNQ